MPISDNFSAADTSGHLDFKYSVTHVSDHANCGRNPDSHDWLWTVLLLDDEAQLAGCLRGELFFLFLTHWVAITLAETGR